MKKVSKCFVVSEIFPIFASKVVTKNDYYYFKQKN